jgi:hypothetical protein
MAATRVVITADITAVRMPDNHRMRAGLVALLMVFCLPLLWAGMAAAPVRVLASCAHAHAHDSAAADACRVVMDDHAVDPNALHLDCGSCHAGAMLATGHRLVAIDARSARLPAEPHPLNAALLAERPERPQWFALA